MANPIVFEQKQRFDMHVKCIECDDYMDIMPYEGEWCGIKFKCPKCGKKIKIDLGQLTENGKCFSTLNVRELD